MYGAVFFVTALATREKEQAQKARQFANQADQDKHFYFLNRLGALKSDDDFIRFYRALLNGKEQICTKNKFGKYQNTPILLTDFFAHLSCVQTPQETADMITQKSLLKETVTFGGIWNYPDQIRPKSSISTFFDCVRDLRQRAGSNLGLFIERSFKKDFTDIVKAITPVQKEPRCAFNNPPSFLKMYPDNFEIKDLLHGIDRVSYPTVRAALKESLIKHHADFPAELIALNEQKMADIYFDFLAKDTPKKTMNEFKQHVLKLAQTDEIKDHLIPPCPAVKVNSFLGMFKTPFVDKTRRYECPIFKHSLQNARQKTKE